MIILGDTRSINFPMQCIQKLCSGHLNHYVLLHQRLDVKSMHIIYNLQKILQILMVNMDFEKIQLLSPCHSFLPSLPKIGNFLSLYLLISLLSSYLILSSLSLSIKEPFANFPFLLSFSPIGRIPHTAHGAQITPLPPYLNLFLVFIHI